MAALIDAIDVKRKMSFEFENVPYYCLESEISTPTARGGQTLVRLKCVTCSPAPSSTRPSKPATSSKSPTCRPSRPPTFIATPMAPTSSTRRPSKPSPSASDIVGDALDLLIEGAIVQIDKYNGNPIGLQLPAQVELEVTYTEPGVRGDTAERQRNQSLPNWKPASKFAFPCS